MEKNMENEMETWENIKIIRGYIGIIIGILILRPPKEGGFINHGSKSILRAPVGKAPLPYRPLTGFASGCCMIGASLETKPKLPKLQGFGLPRPS